MSASGSPRETLSRTLDLGTSQADPAENAYAGTLSASAAAPPALHDFTDNGSPSFPVHLEDIPGSPPLPAFYPTVPLLPSSADLAFLAGMPTPCVHLYPEPQDPQDLHSGSQDLQPAPQVLDPAPSPSNVTDNPRTPSPSAHPPIAPNTGNTSPSSPPPTVPRPAPATPPSMSNRKVPSDPSSTPPVSPQVQPGGEPAVSGSATPVAGASSHGSGFSAAAYYEEDPDPEQSSAMLHCHRKLWQGTTAHGVRLLRSDTWAHGQVWRRHVRIIKGVESVLPSPEPIIGPFGGPNLDLEVGLGG